LSSTEKYLSIVKRHRKEEDNITYAQDRIDKIRKLIKKLNANPPGPTDSKKLHRRYETALRNSRVELTKWVEEYNRLIEALPHEERIKLALSNI